MKIIDLSGKGAAIDGAENDANLSSLSGINSPIITTTHTIDVDDQNDTIEYLNASAIAVTLPTIASVSGSNIHTDDFKVTLKNIGAGVVTVTRGGTDTFDDGSTSIDIVQFECLILQTDNSLTKWNVLPSNIDNATKTGAQEFTDKTLTSPIINEILDSNGNELVKFTTVAVAVNEITIANAVSGDEPTITATGLNTNIDVPINGKGIGSLQTNGQRVHGMKILDVPEILTSTPPTDRTWTSTSALASTTLTTAQAVTAIVRMTVGETTITTDTTVAGFISKDLTGAIGLTSEVEYKIASARDRSSAAITIASATGEGVVNLDASYDFSYGTYISPTSTAQEFVLTLVGYYV